MKKIMFVFSLICCIAFLCPGSKSFAETLHIKLPFGARIQVPSDWKDLGSELDLQAETSAIEDQLKAMGLAENAPEQPLISLGSPTGSPPTMISVLYRDCVEADCPDSDHFEHLINNRAEALADEKREQERVDKLNSEQGHKVLQHFPMQVKRECHAYSIAGGQEVAMYGQLDYVSKIKVIYSGDKLLGMTIGYPAADQEHGEIAEDSLSSFGCN